MDESPVVITRRIELDVEGDDAWRLISEAAGWAGWMVDDADVDVVDGAIGTVGDGDERRDVHIGEVSRRDQRVTFDWWPSDDPQRASTVELQLVTIGGAVVLQIAETFPRRSTLTASAALRWDLRLALPLLGRPVLARLR
jgi:hypothetical protein